VRLDPRSGKVSVWQVSAAHDCGLVVNPDGVKNQVEGNVLQALSRALMEEVVFDREGVTALDWSSYPILRFSDVPEKVDVMLLNRPDLPMLGAGEATTSPVAAAVANAIFDATGRRIRQLPLTPLRVRAALA
jgi:CO/xanthine dehydrogenase Mo-binding subunit